MVENTQDTHFNISAAVVRQLGDQLVSDEVTALMELVKNSYDADAKWVKVEIDTRASPDDPVLNFNQSKGYVLIEDNGFGMNESEIKNGWMIISLSSKRRMKALGETTPLGRTPLGDKGLGRLSTQKLGDQLEMITCKEQESLMHHVAFKWSDFNDNISLTAVPVSYNSVEKGNWKKGTKLYITELKDKTVWEKGAVDTIKGQLSQLLFPFKERRPFQVYLKVNGEPIDLDELTANLRKLGVSSYSFELTNDTLFILGSVQLSKLRGNEPDSFEQLISQDFGNDFVEFLMDSERNTKDFLKDITKSTSNATLFDFKIALDVKRDLSLDHDGEKIAHPGTFYGELDEFDLRGNENLNSAFDNLAQFKTLIKNQVGIRVFRDGFGIKPYGLDGNDWLRLSSSQTSGTFYNLRPNNIIGFIALTGAENKNLKEKTDREGFIEDAYTKNFFKIMNAVINRINDVLNKTKRSYNEYKKLKSSEKGSIKSTTDSLKRIKDTSTKAKGISAKSLQVRANLKIIEETIAIVKSKEASKTIKLSADQQNLITQIDTLLIGAKVLLQEIDVLLFEAQRLDADADYLAPKIVDLETQLSEFSELAGLGLTAEALSHEILNIADRLLDQSNMLQKRLKPNAPIDTAALFTFIEYVGSAVKALRKQMSHLAPSLRYVREKVDDIKTKEFLMELIEFYNEKFDGELEIITITKGQDFTIEANKGKLIQIFDNIILNSEYWLRQKKKAEKDFRAKITIEVSNPFIRIFDNGWGIDPSIEDRIFQPFVTAKPKGVGRGLGLFIIQQLLDTINCDITLLSERNVDKRRYIFQINLSSIIK